MVESNKMIPIEITDFITELESDKDSLNKKARLKLAHLKVLCTNGTMTNKIQQEYEVLVKITKEPKELSLEDLTYGGDIEDLVSDPSLSETLPYLMGKLVKVLNEEEPDDGEEPVLDKILQLAADNDLDAEKLYFGGDLEKWLAVIKGDGALAKQAKLTYVNLVIAGDFGPVEHVDATIASYLKLMKNKKEEEMKNVNEDITEEAINEEEAKAEETMKEETLKEEAKAGDKNEKEDNKKESSFKNKVVTTGKYLAVSAAIVGVAYGIGYGIGKLMGTDSGDIEIPDSIM